MSLRNDLLDVLNAAAAPAKVYDTAGPRDAENKAQADRYGVAFFGNGVLRADDLGYTADDLTTTVQVTSVGRDPNEAHWVASRIRDTIVGNRPTATGWSLGVWEHDISQTARRDDDLPDRAVFYVVDIYKLRGTKA